MTGSDTPMNYALKQAPDSLEWDSCPDLKEGHMYHYHISHGDDHDDEHLSKHLDQQLTAHDFCSLEIEGGESQFCERFDNCQRILMILSPSFECDPNNTENFIEQGTFKKRRFIIPILNNISPALIPSYIKEVNYLQTSDPDFWKKLLRALTEEVPATACLPAGEIGDGLAWGYLYGYLTFVLLGLPERAAQYEVFSSSEDVLRKLIILLPRSGFSARTLDQLDSNIIPIMTDDKKRLMVKHSVVRAGNAKRDMNMAVWKVKDPDSKMTYPVMMECAAPLMTMYEMECGQLAGLDRDNKAQQIEQFQVKLEEILNHPSNHLCRNNVVLLPFDDLKSSDDHELSRVVAKRIQEELTKQPQPIEH